LCFPEHKPHHLLNIHHSFAGGKADVDCTRGGAMLLSTVFVLLKIKNARGFVPWTNDREAE
jgi:hypothetical protein